MMHSYIQLLYGVNTMSGVLILVVMDDALVQKAAVASATVVNRS